VSNDDRVLPSGAFASYCEAPQCQARIVDPWHAAIIAAVVSALVFFGKWIALERSVESMDKMSKRLHLNSPTPLLIELNQAYPMMWIGLAAVVALVSALVHGKLLRHSSHSSVIMGSFGVPGGIIVALWVATAIFFKVW
jgi:hypothetical protein